MAVSTKTVSSSTQASGLFHYIHALNDKRLISLFPAQYVDSQLSNTDEITQKHERENRTSYEQLKLAQ